MANWGIVVDGDAKPTIRRNTITTANLERFSGGILNLGRNDPGLRIYANHIHHMPGAGIVVEATDAGASASIYDNVIEYNGAAGNSGRGGVVVRRFWEGQLDLGGADTVPATMCSAAISHGIWSTTPRTRSWLSTTPGPTGRDPSSIDTTSTTTTRTRTTGLSASESLLYRAPSGRLEARAGAVLPALSAKATRSRRGR